MTKKSSPRKMNLYANLSHKRKTKKDLKARKRAEYLATLPKHPVKRFFARMHPRRVAGYWFSRKGGMMLLKIVGVLVLVGVLTIGSLFAYYRRDLNSIRPSELAKRVQTTVTKYYDRNGQLLWEDKGDGDYKLVVKSDQINPYMKEATVAIEDRDFYNHRGVSPTGLARAAFNNASGGSTQGGSTLTQQLVKQVFFSDESQDRGLSGVPRKIKELILAIEVERMYDKDQILTLYLNESPYGGRRNGVESGAQTYFGKSANDLSLPEAALLAAIPNQPGLYDPYNEAGHEALIARQHKVLDSMRETGKITQKEADDAKAYDVIANIKPQVNTNENIKAPHFVLEVRKQLEKELGKATVGRGGLTVKTTLDLKAQEAAEKAVATGAGMLKNYGADNLSLSSVDVKTGQIIAMVGSVDYNKDIYGQQNSATSPLEPGSSIKPIADYAPLFKQREGTNYAPGSILKDENINSIYCAGSTSSCSLNNYTRRFYGNVPIRQSLAGSLNIPAVKAMQINGVEDSLKTARDLGDSSYCTDNNNAGLSAAIGGGCTVKQVEHTNAYASLARGGSYKPLAYVLEVRNASNEVLKKWEDPKAKQVVDPQVAYMLSSILSDASARSITFGSQGSSYGFVVPNVWTASKTGTTENGNGQAKDSWFMNYSPAVATGVWMGNHDGKPLGSSDNSVVRRVSNDYTAAVHTQVYQPAKQWTPNQQITRPDGMKDLVINGKKDIYPSWYDQKTAATAVKMTFDSVSKKKATDCTPEGARVELSVTKTTDPITKKDAYIAPDGYDASKDDDKHKCDDIKPSVTVTVTKSGSNVTITANATQGTNPLTSLKISVGDTVVADVPVSGSGSYSATTTVTGPQTITATLQDSALYSASGSQQYSP
ncbi:transglycosylase domain-containing protein [Candidatus Mycosynbacter amalyticus]|uniref:transglycosylase domain-containing protein n=1 Tax=Candidatus Mycosynbacter amalyticus TaxID=2665156 RepID=UPI0021B26009|nr:transglycosylase domain-containing protein [Candidatus Mycosynbacter amalyticus]